MDEFVFTDFQHNSQSTAPHRTTARSSISTSVQRRQRSNTPFFCNSLPILLKSETFPLAHHPSFMFCPVTQGWVRWLTSDSCRCRVVLSRCCVSSLLQVVTWTLSLLLIPSSRVPVPNATWYVGSCWYVWMYVDVWLKWCHVGHVYGSMGWWSWSCFRCGRF